jgi:hemerythrin-like domain-containing protein
MSDALNDRDGLPEPLKVLLADYPREAWEAHPQFTGLVQFWLERHLMFRRLQAALEEDLQAAVDGKMDPQSHMSRLSRLGGMLVNQLHGHHQIEDMHYFPTLSSLDPRLVHGFTILDKDHHALDELLANFTDGANSVLQGGEAEAFQPHLIQFGGFLERHLWDEEDIIVPVLLKHEGAGLE